MAYFKDQTQYQISLEKTPRRIVSLVPSQTELLWTLGLEKEVVGITKFCVHPKAWFENKERVGGTKKLNLEKIKSLKPDLILGNKEENNKEDIESLRTEFPVWLSNVHDLNSAVEMIDQVGVMTNKIPASQQLIHKIFNAQLDLPKLNKTALYLIWNDPLMTAGKGTFIDAMISEAGFENVLTTTRYPELSDEEVKVLNPDFIFLSSEPFPFQEKHQLAYQERFPDSQVVLVDGELFSWYGSRLLQSFDYFRNLNEKLCAV